MASLLLNIFVDETLSEQLLVTCDKVVYTTKDILMLGDERDNIKPDRVNDVNYVVKEFGDTQAVSKKSDMTTNIGNLEMSSHPEGHCCVGLRREKAKARKDNLRLYMDGYFLSVFINILFSSVCFRRKVVDNFNLMKRTGDVLNKSRIVKINLKAPRSDIIDYSWNEKLERILIIHRESDNALSWLSTFGGAFSALGDYMEHCAVMAGRISIQQLRIALRLGDPLIAARCKLWLALSLIQRGYLGRARQLVREQYRLAHSLPVLDTRLVRMCHGIWSRLQYAHRLRHQAKKKSIRSL